MRNHDGGSPLSDLLASGSPLTWVTAGDSVAQGARWTAGARDYAQLLEERVRYELGRPGDTFARTAVSGWRITDVLGGIEHVDRLAPDVVLLGVGLNDAKLGTAGLPGFTRSYQEAVEHLRARGALVLVQTPNAVRPDAHATLRACLPAYVDAIRTLGERCGAAVVDHHRVWSERGDGQAPGRWMADPTHPNAHGHRVMARTLFEECGLWDEASECCRPLQP